MGTWRNNWDSDISKLGYPEPTYNMTIEELRYKMRIPADASRDHIEMHSGTDPIVHSNIYYNIGRRVPFQVKRSRSLNVD